MLLWECYPCFIFICPVFVPISFKRVFLSEPGEVGADHHSLTQHNLPGIIKPCHSLRYNRSPYTLPKRAYLILSLMHFQKVDRDREMYMQQSQICCMVMAVDVSNNV